MISKLHAKCLQKKFCWNWFLYVKKNYDDSELWWFRTTYKVPQVSDTGRSLPSVHHRVSGEYLNIWVSIPYTGTHRWLCYIDSSLSLSPSLALSLPLSPPLWLTCSLYSAQQHWLRHRGNNCTEIQPPGEGQYWNNCYNNMKTGTHTPTVRPSPTPGPSSSHTRTHTMTVLQWALRNGKTKMDFMT